MEILFWILIAVSNNYHTMGTVTAFDTQYSSVDSCRASADYANKQIDDEFRERVSKFMCIPRYK